MQLPFETDAPDHGDVDSGVRHWGLDCRRLEASSTVAVMGNRCSTRVILKSENAWIYACGDELDALFWQRTKCLTSRPRPQESM
jgi:hypothetical protein